MRAASEKGQKNFYLRKKSADITNYSSNFFFKSDPPHHYDFCCG